MEREKAKRKIKAALEKMAEYVRRFDEVCGTIRKKFT